VERQVFEGQSQVLAELAGAVNLPGERAHLEEAISDRSGATPRATFASPPQESSDVSAEGDIAEIPDLEADTYANVVVSTNVEQTTHTALGLGIGVGVSVVGNSVPAVSGFPPMSYRSHLAAETTSRDPSQSSNLLWIARAKIRWSKTMHRPRLHVATTLERSENEF